MDNVEVYAQMIRLLATLPGGGGKMPQPAPVRPDIREFIHQADRRQLEGVLVETLVALSHRRDAPRSPQGSETGVDGR